MSRAQGKHPQRGSLVERLLDELTGDGDKPLTEGEKAQLGIGPEREIPGGLNHLANPPVKTQTVPVPAREYPYSNAILAHGVEPEGHMHTRDPRLTGGQPGTPPEYTKPPPLVSPVPVYITEGSEGPKILRTASPRFITCPAATSGVPARVCGKNPDRVEIRLLNEDTATDIRIGLSPGDLSLDVENSVITGGALVPWPNNSYLSFPTQDELYAIGKTGSGTPKLSIIEIFEVREGQ
jgi:hypothetical protein